MQLPDFDWIFFDCFNTLIDDFDQAGQEGSLLSIPQLAVDLGFFPGLDEFHAAYAKVRNQAVRLGRETVLVDRLRQTLQESPGDRTRDEIAATAERLAGAWEAEYSTVLRPAPGVGEMLQFWAGKKALGVVTNSPVPGMPMHCLERFGLSRYFRFVLDSATQGFRQPNPLLGMEALSMAGLGPCDGHRVLAVGDRHDIDLAAAADLGMHLLHFNRRHTRPGVEPSPDGIPVIHDWSEFR